jgi:hypothetical protein
MCERGDLDCLHEPFMYDYYVHRRAGHMPHFDLQPDHPVRYQDIRTMLLERAGAGPVFVKDMAYYVTPHLMEDAEFRDRLTHAFLVRDPHAAILSYHRLDPRMSHEEVGLEAQWQLYQGLTAAGHRPPVLCAEDIRRDPHGMMHVFWSAVGLPDVPGALDWAGPPPEEWEQVGPWHETASASDGIRPMRPGHAAQAAADFATLAQNEPRLQDILDRHMPAYRALAARRLGIAGEGQHP